MDVLNWWKGMENALDAASLRQQVIANNIANAGSPNFTAQKVAFEEELQKAAAGDKGDLDIRAVSLDGSDDKAIGGGLNWQTIKPKVVNSGEKVDIHQEMANLTKNQIYYNMVSDKIGGMMKGLIGIVDQLQR